jgi:hypothetical protein
MSWRGRWPQPRRLNVQHSTSNAQRSSKAPGAEIRRENKILTDSSTDWATGRRCGQGPPRRRGAAPPGLHDRRASGIGPESRVDAEVLPPLRRWDRSATFGRSRRSGCRAPRVSPRRTAACGEAALRAVAAEAFVRPWRKPFPTLQGNAFRLWRTRLWRERRHYEPGLRQRSHGGQEFHAAMVGRPRCPAGPPEHGVRVFGYQAPGATPLTRRALPG